MSGPPTPVTWRTVALRRMLVTRSRLLITVVNAPESNAKVMWTVSVRGVAGAIARIWWGMRAASMRSKSARACAVSRASSSARAAWSAGALEQTESQSESEKLTRSGTSSWSSAMMTSTSASAPLVGAVVSMAVVVGPAVAPRAGAPVFHMAEVQRRA